MRQRALQIDLEAGEFILALDDGRPSEGNDLSLAEAGASLKSCGQHARVVDRVCFGQVREVDIFEAQWTGVVLTEAETGRIFSSEV